MEKKLFNIYNGEKDEYVKLTDNEIAFLLWLKHEGFLSSRTYFDEVASLPKPIEF